MKNPFEDPIYDDLEPIPDEERMTPEPRYRCGRRVTQNVYDNERPIFQAHTVEDACILIKTLNDGLALDTERAAHAETREQLVQVQKVVALYFSPWGAAKAAQWEEVAGDGPFNSERALELIRAALRANSK